METYFSILQKSPLFTDTKPEEIRRMLACLSGRVRTVEPKETVYAAGERVLAFGVLLAGSADIVQQDFWGNQGILTRLASGDIFAESFALAGVDRLPVSVVAERTSTVLLLDSRKMLQPCANTCGFHTKLMTNLLAIVARKNIALTQKMELITKRTLREKLLAYLSVEAQKVDSNAFTIPYDRQALADYLAVDRSALSRVLGDMRREGLIANTKNHFVLLE